MKKIFLSLVLMLSLLSGLPVLNIKAITCSGDRFSIDQIIDPDHAFTPRLFYLDGLRWGQGIV